MADDLSVSRVPEAPRDGGKPNTNARGKRRPAPSRPAAAAPPATKDEAPGETSSEHRLDLLV